MRAWPDSLRFPPARCWPPTASTSAAPARAGPPTATCGPGAGRCVAPAALQRRPRRSRPAAAGAGDNARMIPFPRSRRRPAPAPAPLALALPFALALAAAPAAAAPGGAVRAVQGGAPEGAPVDATTLDRVVVDATRLRAVPAFDAPASTATVGLAGDRATADADVAEVLRGIPGLLARDRQNLAQDTQLSIRGFGARATFGVRGLRLYADGIPASMPDGQGQLSHFSLAGADRIEVLRGPFSALHGNSSGGVVSLH